MTRTINIKQILAYTFYALTIAFAYIGIKSLLTSLTPEHGLISIDGQYIGRDFLPFYAAAKQVLAGHIHDLYTEFGAYNATHLLAPEPTNFTISHWPWPYPPHYFLLLAPFAILPYKLALFAWLALSLLLPSLILWYGWRVRGWLFFATILNINVFICLIMGQNALIFSSIAGLGISLVRKRPLISGICFAILSMKPHFAVLIPLTLLFGRYYQAIFYTIFSTLCLILITSLAFGFDIWEVAFANYHAVGNISFSPEIWTFSIYSTYRALLSLGFSSYYAWVGQFLVAGLALYSLQKIWRENYPLVTKWLAFGITALLFSPFSFAYDAVWITLPAMVYIASLRGGVADKAIQKNEENKDWIASPQKRFVSRNDELSTTDYLLFSVQIFAFAIISISHYFALFIIIDAVVILLRFALFPMYANHQVLTSP